MVDVNSVDELIELIKQCIPTPKTIICHPDDRALVEKAVEQLGAQKHFAITTSWATDKGKLIVGDVGRFW